LEGRRESLRAASSRGDVESGGGGLRRADAAAATAAAADADAAVPDETAVADWCA